MATLDRAIKVNQIRCRTDYISEGIDRYFIVIDIIPSSETVKIRFLSKKSTTHTFDHKYTLIHSEIVENSDDIQGK